MFARRKNDPALDIEIPVTPMLDMAFQLLTFFVFTYHPSTMEGQIEMSLPSSGICVPGVGVNDPPLAIEDGALLIRLRTQQGGDGAGNIAFPIEFEGPLIKGVIEGVDELETVLTKLRKDGRISGSARIEADRRLKWAFVVEIMDACKRAELNVLLAAPPDR